MQREYVNPSALPYTAPAYSQAVAVRGGRTIYVAGQLGVDADGKLVGPGDVAVQLQQALHNLTVALEAAGADFTAIVKLTYYVVNYTPEMLPVIRTARQPFFLSENRPASTLVGVAALAEEGLLIEVEAVAVTP